LALSITPGVVYSGVRKKVNMRGTTVAMPYMAVCLNRFFERLNCFLDI